MGKIKTFFSADDTHHLKKKGYTVLGDLGEGTYSKVKHAIWVKPGDTSQVKVALKIINKKTAPKDFLDKFLPREIEVMKKLKHPNLIRLYELFQVSSKLYFTLEWGGHGDLLQYIRLRGALKETESRKYFREMCFGVEYMHQLGVVHRDLKCENLLLSKKNTIKIADFGFAREIGANETSKTYCGSAAYAAPELLQGIPYTGTIADIWSLGVILYIMSCSSMPFRDANIKTLLKDQKDKLHIPSSVVATLNSSLKELMKKIMCFDLHKRFMMREIKAHAWFHKHGSDDQPADNNDNDTHEVAAETSGTKS